VPQIEWQTVWHKQEAIEAVKTEATASEAYKLYLNVFNILYSFYTHTHICILTHIYEWKIASLQ